MQSLSKNQEQIRDYFQSTLGTVFPFGSTLEQMSKQNMAMFERTMRMFTPFGATGEATPGDAAEPQMPETPVTSTPAPASKKSARAAETASGLSAKAEAQEAAEEAAFTPSSNLSSTKRERMAAVPTPETNRAAAQSNVSGDDVQTKIAALQRQLSDLAKNKA